jgi:NADH-quinone oxidoreductase subunit G
MQTGRNQKLESLKSNAWLIPMKSYVEKDGTFLNHKGLERKFKKVTTVVSEALTLIEAAELLLGRAPLLRPQGTPFVETSRPADRVTIEHRKKNEFVLRRGTL